MNALEVGVLTTPPEKDGYHPFHPGGGPRIHPENGWSYTIPGIGHYDTISAFIKSIRGSDPDAALYWLAKMLYAGEDPRFIARRLVILASEDVGNADPQALLGRLRRPASVGILGLPEGRIPLAQATVYLATAPKSNASYMGLENATEDVKNRNPRKRFPTTCATPPIPE